jgi:carbamoyltransferase
VRVLGVNAVFHDPAAALVVDGRVVAAAEEERFSRRKHGKRPVPFSTWELPESAARWCLREGGLGADEIDAVAYSYDPSLAPARNGDITRDGWEGLRTLYAERAPLFLAAALPGLDRARVRHVAHHVAHAASAYLQAPFGECAVMVLDGRGESTSALLGEARGGRLRTLATQRLPHSLGLLYEELTAHLGFLRSSDEYKVMALAAYGAPTGLPELRGRVRTTADGGFRVDRPDFATLAADEADVAASVQARLEEVLLELAGWLHDRTGLGDLAMAGGVALNCVANSRLLREGPFRSIWVQPAAGDAGTALGAALTVAREGGDDIEPMTSAALGRGFSDVEIEDALVGAGLRFERPPDVAAAAARVLAEDGLVAWFQGRSEWGPRALGHRSLLANPGRAGTTDRLNAVKGRERFRPVAPMVPLERAAEVFDGPVPSPYMLFTHRVRTGWRERIPAALHVDGTARVQTVDVRDEPLVHRVLSEVDRLTGCPVVINTSLNTAGRPIVDDPRDALECFGSAPIDALAVGPFLLRRAGVSA